MARREYLVKVNIAYGLHLMIELLLWFTPLRLLVTFSSSVSLGELFSTIS